MPKAKGGRAAPIGERLRDFALFCGGRGSRLLTSAGKGPGCRRRPKPSQRAGGEREGERILRARSRGHRSQGPRTRLRRSVGKSTSAVPAYAATIAARCPRTARSQGVQRRSTRSTRRKPRLSSRPPPRVLFPWPPGGALLADSALRRMARAASRRLSDWTLRRRNQLALGKPYWLSRLWPCSSSPSDPTAG
jgi:hypothetical protein